MQGYAKLDEIIQPINFYCCSNKIGVGFCKGQSYRCHNIILGLFHILKSQNIDSVFIGFVGIKLTKRIKC